ncbi:unnamed protein product, partial [Rotaria socialis]
RIQTGLYVALKVTISDENELYDSQYLLENINKSKRSFAVLRFTCCESVDLDQTKVVSTFQDLNVSPAAFEADLNTPAMWMTWYFEVINQ